MQIIGGARWLDEPLSQNIGGARALGPHEVGAYARKQLLLGHFSVVRQRATQPHNFQTNANPNPKP